MVGALGTGYRDTGRSRWQPALARLGLLALHRRTDDVLAGAGPDDLSATTQRELERRRRRARGAEAREEAADRRHPGDGWRRGLDHECCGAADGGGGLR